MTTQDISDLVDEVLKTFPKPFSADLIDQVCSAISGNADWLVRYENFVAIHGKNIVNNMLGRYVFKLSGAKQSGKIKQAKCNLLKKYKELMFDLTEEKHLKISYGDRGHTYESLFGNYLRGSEKIEVRDPFIRADYQLENFIRFCELIVKTGGVREIELETAHDKDTLQNVAAKKFLSLKDSLAKYGIAFKVSFNQHLHDREIKIDNGWIIKIGRGLDFYQRPTPFTIGAHDFELRPCQETMVDIYHYK
jgi:hypothetical protein